MDVYRLLILLTHVLLSIEVTLGLIKSPAIEPAPKATVTENDSLELTCTYDRDGVCPYDTLLIWMLNGTEKLATHFRGLDCVPVSGDSTLMSSCSGADGKCISRLKLIQVKNSQHGDRWSCIADKSNERIESPEASVYVNVPITGVQLTSPNVSQISVVENVPYNLSCLTTIGRPDSTVHWYIDLWYKVELTGAVSEIVPAGTLSVTRSTLSYTATNRSKVYSDIYCKAYNMGPSTSHTSSRTAVITGVLYPPVISPLQNRDVTATSTLTVQCTTTSGNPTQTSYRWTRSTDSWSQGGQTLSLPSVTKGDAAVYTCTAWNAMTPTGGSPVDGIDTETLTVNVLYPPVINPLQNRDFIASSSLTVQCTTTPGNPAQASFRWTRSTDSWSQRGQTLSLPSVTKGDAAVYTCTAWNVMTSTGGSPVDGIDTETLTVNVMYPPRAHDTVNKFTYYSALNESVTLNLTFTAYPAPTSIQWFKQLPDAIWENIRTGISSDHQQSNLTLQLRTQDDFGQYKVEVANDLGKMDHLFFVSEHGLPSAPQQFRIIGSPIEPIFSWEGGNNGGYQQTFIIEVSPGGQNMWIEKLSINELDANHTLPNGFYVAVLSKLDPGSYKARVLSSNKLGKSKMSDLPLPFSVQQRNGPGTECLQQSAVSAGAIAGGVMAGIAAVVMVAVVFYILWIRRGHLTKTDKDNEDKVGSNESNQQTSQERNENYDNIVSGPVGPNDISEAPRNVYEQLDPALRKESVYSAVNPTNENIKLDDAGAEYINLNVHTP